ncbi:hypothetical protein FisN_2Lu019 [Fistulifera solaris]|uniref:BspA family leucine-rich repeat surface protein n=1 Tax=Fistulifera solaris TaxID=1519565 RepID=A0A1Z5JX58_FISSO|nr:hypothetical protein FisN_2Lu019 [Fistulifera solaris]|eukprot:GAX18398.1 hypothetical protein FisN_2Lu019 [Fistulifera solaris]
MNDNHFLLFSLLDRNNVFWNCRHSNPCPNGRRVFDDKVELQTSHLNVLVCITRKIIQTKLLRCFPALNQDIGRWDTAKVTNMGRMFSGATAFDQEIGGWDTSAVNTMEDMFFYAPLFHGDISRWNTSAVTSMEGMLFGAYHF